MVKVLSRKTRAFLKLLVALPTTSSSALLETARILKAQLPKLQTAEGALGKYSGIPGENHFEMARKGQWTEDHFGVLTKLLLSESGTALDIGANIGTHTVHMAKLVPNGTVFSMEPQSLNHAILQANILNNALTNVRPFPFAASDETGQVIAIHMPVAGEFNSGLSKIENANNLGDKSITYKVDDLGLPKIDFIKIDVQGSELRALKGAEQLLDRDRPTIFVEVEEGHLRSLGTSSKEVMEWILAKSYTLFRVQTDYPCDHICVPNENVDDFRSKLLSEYPYEVMKIAGRRIELTFAKPNDQNYADVKVVS